MFKKKDQVKKKTFGIFKLYHDLRDLLDDIFYTRSVIKNEFTYFSTKTYVVGAQKKRLNETVLLSTQNKCLN